MGLDAATRDRVSAFMMATRVEMVVGAVQATYALVILVLGLGVVVLATKGSVHYPPETWACVALGFEGYALTYLGLRLRRPWVVPLIVWESACLMTPCLSRPPEGLAAVVVVRAVSMLALCQLWFFSRPATRRFFGAEGPVIL
jgi:hypothetical protein